MTGRAGTGGRAKSRFGGNVYPTHKDCDNCSPFQLERHYIVFDSKKGSGNKIQIREEKKERLPNVGRATELEGSTFSECSRISSLMLEEGFSWHSGNPRAEKSLTSLTTFIVIKQDNVTFAQLELLIIMDNNGLILKVEKSHKVIISTQSL